MRGAVEAQMKDIALKPTDAAPLQQAVGQQPAEHGEEEEVGHAEISAKETALTAPSDQSSILAATWSEGFRFPPLILVRYGREIPSCAATATSVSFLASMNRASGVTAQMCPIGTFRVKTFVSAQAYTPPCGRRTICL